MFECMDICVCVYVAVCVCHSRGIGYTAQLCLSQVWKKDERSGSLVRDDADGKGLTLICRLTLAPSAILVECDCNDRHLFCPVAIAALRYCAVNPSRVRTHMCARSSASFISYHSWVARCIAL